MVMLPLDAGYSRPGRPVRAPKFDRKPEFPDPEAGSLFHAAFDLAKSAQAYERKIAAADDELVAATKQALAIMSPAERAEVLRDIEGVQYED